MDFLHFYIDDIFYTISFFLLYIWDLIIRRF